MKLEYFVPFLCCSLLGACFHVGPKAEDKTPFDRLSGKSYESVGNVGPVYAVESTQRITRIEGHLLNEATLPMPLGFATVHLRSKDGKVNDRTQSGADGRFSFSGHYPNGLYSIDAETKKFEGHLDFRVEAWEVPDLTVDAHARR